MKIYVKNKKREREIPGRGEIEIDVGGLTKFEADEFVDEVKRRVKIKSLPQKREQDRSDRRTIDVNINVNRD